MPINILHLFQNKELENFCLEVLNDNDLNEFTPGQFPHAQLVLTDTGITVGRIPGFVPVLLLIDEDKPYPDSFYTRIIDEDLTGDDLHDEIEHSAYQADVGKSINLHEAEPLNTGKLD
ncbi:MAG: hypothetical protein P8X57_10680, partial [Cyclobacteriaceae bacterium]